MIKKGNNQNKRKEEKKSKLKSITKAIRDKHSLKQVCNLIR